MLELPRVERVPCYWRRMNRLEPKANLRAPPVCIKKEPWRGQTEPSPLWQLNHHCPNTNRTPHTSPLVANKLLRRARVAVTPPPTSSKIIYSTTYGRWLWMSRCHRQLCLRPWLHLYTYIMQIFKLTHSYNRALFLI